VQGSRKRLFRRLWGTKHCGCSSHRDDGEGKKPLASKPSSYHQANILQPLHPTVRADVQTSPGRVVIPWLPRGLITPRLTTRNRDQPNSPQEGDALSQPEASPNTQRTQDPTCVLAGVDHGGDNHVLIGYGAQFGSSQTSETHTRGTGSQSPSAQPSGGGNLRLEEGLAGAYGQIWPPTP